MRKMIDSVRSSKRETIDSVRMSWKETLNETLNSVERRLKKRSVSRKEMIVFERRRLTEMIDFVRKTKLTSSKPGSPIVTLRHKERKTHKNLPSSKSVKRFKKSLRRTKRVWK